MSAKMCSVVGCEKRFLAKGMCQMHYLRVKKHGDPHYKRPTAAQIGCAVEKCGRPHDQHGYCHTHAARLWRRGTLEVRELMDHFERYEVDLHTGCWQWTGPVFQANGYGQMGVAYEGTSVAHRAFYIREYGAIPGDAVLDHLCRNRRCVNVDHLDLTTVAENTKRGLSSYAIRDKCKSAGHDISTPGSWYVARGARTCLECARAGWAKRREVERIARRRQREASWDAVKA